MNSQRNLVKMFNLKTDDGLKKYNEELNKFAEYYKDQLDLDDSIRIIVRPDITLNTKTDGTYQYKGTNVNVAITSAVTAKGRLALFQFMNKTGETLFYTDTDSLFRDKSLPDYMVVIS